MATGQRTYHHLFTERDDRGIAMLDPTDWRGVKNSYIDLLQQLAFRECCPLHGGEVALDYACGTGRITRWLTREAGWVVGADPSLRLVRIARENIAEPNTSWVGIDPGGLPFQVGRFDVILCVGMLQTQEPGDVEALLTGFDRLLKPSGSLCCIEKLYRLPRRGRYTLDHFRGLSDRLGMPLKAAYPIRKGHWFPLCLMRYGLFPRRYLHRLARHELKSRRRRPMNRRDYYHCLLHYAPSGR